MTRHDLSLRALFLILVTVLSAPSAVVLADGTTPVIVVSSGEVISPSASLEPSARYAFHQTYGEPNAGAPMPSVWIYVTAQRKPPQLSGSINGALSYGSGELIIPAPLQGTSTSIGSEHARPMVVPAVLMVVLAQGMPQHQGPGVSVGVILVDQPDPWAQLPVKIDGQVQVVQPGHQSGSAR